MFNVINGSSSAGPQFYDMVAMFAPSNIASTDRGFLSQDAGETWSEFTLPAVHPWCDSAWNSNIGKWTFIAPGLVAQTSDYVNYTSNVTTMSALRVRYCKEIDKYIYHHRSGATGTDTLYQSSDGLTPVFVTNIGIATWASDWDGTTCSIAMSRANNSLELARGYWTDDALAWSYLPNFGEFAGFDGIAFGAGKCVVIGGAATFRYDCWTSSGTPPFIAGRPPWTKHAAALPNNGNHAWQGLAWNGHVFFTGNSSNTIGAISADGITWTQVTLPYSVSTLIAQANGEYHVYLNSTSLKSCRSIDGRTWETFSMPATFNPQGTIRPKTDTHY